MNDFTREFEFDSGEVADIGIEYAYDEGQRAIYYNSNSTGTEGIPESVEILSVSKEFTEIVDELSDEEKARIEELALEHVKSY